MKTKFILLLIVILFLYADDWTVGTGGKPGRYSLSNEYGPTDSIILWQGGLSAVIAHQAVIEGNIVAMDRIQDINDVLHGTKIVAHNLQTGETLWTKDLPVDFPATDWRNRVSAIRDGKVYATRSGNTNASYLYALNADTGEIIWRSDSLIDECSTEGASFAPNGDLIIGNFRNIRRIDGATGTTIWTTQRSSPTSNGSEVAVSGNIGYAWEASGQGPRISVYNLETGARLYSSLGLAGLIQQVAPFVGPDGTVYATRTQNNPATDYLVAFVDIDTALEEKWRVPLGYVPFASFGVGPDASVYSYSRTNRVIRIDSRTGTIIDSSQVIFIDFPAEPRMAIDANGNVFVTNGGFANGGLYSFNPDLTLRWSTPIPNVNIGGPAIGQNGILIVCGIGTDVRAYRGSSAIIESKANILLPINLQIYPNPFRKKINIRLTFNHKQISNNYSLKIYDITGKLIKNFSFPGTHLPYSIITWDGLDNNGNTVPRGIYIVKLYNSEGCISKILSKY
ncbi:MAG: PQQ-binding-like beta-propeller repeat protein [bacterium]